jgi:uncharacterized protein (TIGR03437 family)
VLVGKTDLVPGVVSRPAQPGEIISLYGTGFGPTTPQLPDYLVATAPAPLTICQVEEKCQTSVFFVQTQSDGSVTRWSSGQVEYVGLVESGLYQLNVMVPSLSDGDESIVVMINGGTSPYYSPDTTQMGVLITIQN